MPLTPGSDTVYKHQHGLKARYHPGLVLLRPSTLLLAILSLFSCNRGGNPGEDQAVEPIEAAAQAQTVLCETGGKCVEQARVHLQGEGVPEDRALASQLFKRACDLGTMEGCFSLANIYVNPGSSGLQHSPAESVKLLEVACTGGHGQACANLGTRYSQGLGVQEDQSRAVALYKMACEAKNTAGCYSLAKSLRDGEGLAVDASQALHLFERTCDELPESCLAAGRMHQGGRGIPKNLESAVRFFERACDGKHESGCVDLAYAYQDGLGVVADPARADALFELGCKLGRCIHR